MRFLSTTAAFLACSPLLVKATPPPSPGSCDAPTCSFVDISIPSNPSTLTFPTDVTDAVVGSSGDSAALPGFAAVPGAPGGCSTHAIVVSEIVNYDSVDMLRISSYNPECFLPVAHGMTAIQTAGLVAQLDKPTPFGANSCLARFDTDTLQYTCVQPCSQDPDYSCYIGVDAILTVLNLPDTTTQDCNADPNLPLATVLTGQPAIKSLSFSAQNTLDVITTHRQYFSRQPPQISIGDSNCIPSEAWSPTGSLSNNGNASDPECYQDWVGTYHWSDLSNTHCYEGNPDTSASDPAFKQYDYKVTMVEVDELYMRPGLGENLATFRTTTTIQDFSILAKQVADDDAEFRVFDYTNVLSVVTSATLSLSSSTKGQLVIEVYSSVQSQFKFMASGDDAGMNLDENAAYNWQVTNTEEDAGGSDEMFLTFQVDASTGCTLDKGTFHYQVKAECVDNTNPSGCPIPNGGHETLDITIQVPAMDICSESNSTDLTATLHVFGSDSFEDRLAFFTENRTQDFVYVVGVLASDDLSIPDCDVVAASATLEGHASVLLLDNSDVQWTDVWEGVAKASNYPTGMGFTPDAGSCLVMYKFNPTESVFAVPFDQDKALTITFTLQAFLPEKKRSINTATASMDLSLIGPKALPSTSSSSSLEDSSDGNDGAAASSASSLVAQVFVAVSLTALLML